MAVLFNIGMALNIVDGAILSTSNNINDGH